jgi:hypothetical protein
LERGSNTATDVLVIEEIESQLEKVERIVKESRT